LVPDTGREGGSKNERRKVIGEAMARKRAKAPQKEKYKHTYRSVSILKAKRG
jgi:hypothetical protein